MNPTPPSILYCHCAHAQVVPPEVKAAVLKKLSDAGISFEAVADLCEMSARRDPTLRRLATGTSGLKIAACYPRAVKWLFAAAQAPLSLESTEVLNMRTLTADDVAQALFNGALQPNLPAGKAEPSSVTADAPITAAAPTAAADAVSTPA